jgi:D-alanine-D-alanine ligase-like ATP-grasp enzyme
MQSKILIGADPDVLKGHLLNPPEAVKEICEQFLEVSALDFGAIDVIYHRPTNKAYILEGNTAPGLSGTAIEAYAEALKIG